MLHIEENPWGKILETSYYENTALISNLHSDKRTAKSV